MSIQVRRLVSGGRRYDVRLRDPDGEHIKKSFRTRKEAEAFELEQRRNQTQGTWFDPRDADRLFEDVAREWLFSNPGKRPSTLLRDEIVVRTKLVPVLGKTRVGAITPGHVQELVSRWSTERQPRTVIREYGVVKAIMNFAVEREYLARTPCRGIRLPQPRAVNAHVLSADDLRRLTEAMPLAYRPAAYLGAVLGLRWGEVFGLRVGRLDLERATVRIVEQRTRGPEGFGPPKSAAGTRLLALPAGLTVMLREHLERRGLDGTDPAALLFVNRRGRPVGYDAFRTRIWDPACEAAGLPGVHFHDLRRTNATAMVDAGVDVKTVQTRMGQTDPRVAIGLYAQATRDADRVAADKLNTTFFAGSDGSDPSASVQIGLPSARHERAMEPEIGL